MFSSPANQNFEWMPTLPSDPTRYAELKPRPEMKKHMFSDQVKFWTQLAADFKYDPVRMRPLPDGENNPIWQAVKGAEKWFTEIKFYVIWWSFAYFMLSS